MVYRTSMFLLGGSSGSPVVDEDGEMIGMFSKAHGDQSFYLTPSGHEWQHHDDVRVSVGKGAEETGVWKAFRRADVKEKVFKLNMLLLW